MTGLEKIVERIKLENKSECAAIIAAAEKKSEEILANANEAAKARASQVIDEAQREAAKIKTLAYSTAEMNARRDILAEKNRYIDEAISAARAIISAMPDDAYFNVMKKTILENAAAGEGIMKLSAKDLSRLPEGFIEAVNSQLDGGKISIDSTPALIDDGFILVYGDIEQNCTFSAIFAEKLDLLKGVASEVLFSE